MLLYMLILQYTISDIRVVDSCIYVLASGVTFTNIRSPHCIKAKIGT